MHIPVLEDFFLSTYGRINRKKFNLYILACFIIVSFTLSLLFLLEGVDNTIIYILSVINGVIINILLIPATFLSAKRLHDLNRPASWIIFFAIPFINILLFFYLCLIRGSIGYNNYGKDPLYKGLWGMMLCLYLWNN